MAIESKVSLKPHNTFAVNAEAARYLDITDLTQLNGILPLKVDDKSLVMGGGSNLLFTKPTFDGLVLHVDLKGISTQQQDDTILVTAMAGESWHELVCWCVDNNYGGIENLSLIPGSVGAAPVQNIGAYGVELADVLYSVDAYHLESGERHQFSAEECRLAYRDSRFKSDEAGQWLIVAVTLRLTRDKHQLNTGYGAIRQQLEVMGVSSPTIADVSHAVIQIRQQRLPDPNELPNAGSFFKNPVVTAGEYETLLKQFADMPGYSMPSEYIKIPAGWLIEQCGWKGKQEGGCGVHEQHALVIVNQGGASGQQLYRLSQAIVESVFSRFGIQLVSEVNIIQ